MVRWHGSQFDPQDAGAGRILDEFERLARKWAPRARKLKTPSPPPELIDGAAVHAGCLLGTTRFRTLVRTRFIHPIGNDWTWRNLRVRRVRNERPPHSDPIRRALVEPIRRGLIMAGAAMLL
jgi:hypothetical protein